MFHEAAFSPREEQTREFRIGSEGLGLGWGVAKSSSLQATLWSNFQGPRALGWTNHRRGPASFILIITDTPRITSTFTDSHHGQSFRWNPVAALHTPQITTRHPSPRKTRVSKKQEKLINSCLAHNRDPHLPRTIGASPSAECRQRPAAKSKAWLPLSQSSHTFPLPPPWVGRLAWDGR